MPTASASLALATTFALCTLLAGSGLASAQGQTLAAAGPGAWHSAATSDPKPANAHPFAAAEQSALHAGRDLLVVVGAAWCGPCQTVRNRVIPEVAAAGGLDRMEFAYVDFDEQPGLARTLMYGNTVPQIVYLRHDGNQWTRRALIPQEVDTAKVLEMIRWVQALPPPPRPAPMLASGPDAVPGSTLTAGRPQVPGNDFVPSTRPR